MAAGCSGLTARATNSSRHCATAGAVPVTIKGGCYTARAVPAFPKLADRRERCLFRRVGLQVETIRREAHSQTRYRDELEEATAWFILQAGAEPTLTNGASQKPTPGR